MAQQVLREIGKDADKKSEMDVFFISSFELKLNKLPKVTWLRHGLKVKFPVQAGKMCGWRNE